MAAAPHVLQVFQPAIGGVPAYVANLARGLRERGWRVSVAAPAGHSAAAELDGIAEHRLEIGSASGWSPGADARALRALLDFTRHHQVDLLHAHSSKASLLAGLTSAWSGRPSIYTPHTWAFQREGSAAAAAAYAGVEALLARRCHSRVVVVSDCEARAATRWHVASQAALELVCSGLPRTRGRPSRFVARNRLALDPEVPVVAWIGRRHPAKRPQDLGTLATRLRGRAQLVALGQGLVGSPEGSALVQAGGRIVPRAEPRVLLSAADVFVLTSAWEALPFCVLEAMEAGLPVVGYDVGGLHAQVVDGATGFLVSPGDVAELARRVMLLVEDPALRVALGAAARRRLDARFSYDGMVSAIDRVYREVAGWPSPRALVLPARRPPAIRVAHEAHA
jgi:glycosyltransferase involved in cell wall biosynthesis